MIEKIARKLCDTGLKEKKTAHNCFYRSST